MPRNVRQEFGEGGREQGDGPLVKQAQEAVRARNEVARANLIYVQDLEIRHLQGEKNWVEQQKTVDRSAMNNKEIVEINRRYDRLQQILERRHNSIAGKLSRVFGGHKRQQRAVGRLNAQRDAVVAGRTAQHVRREAQYQRSLSERSVKVEVDIREARERHAEAREKQRQAQERGFDHSVKQEVNRLRHVPKLGM